MSEILPFKQIFHNKIFRIPDYQRGYSWEEAQLDDLWADLSNVHLQNNAYHFTGILTINNFSDYDFENLSKEGFENLIDYENKQVKLNEKYYQAYNLVDGQQRLTTILILLSQLCQKLKESEHQQKITEEYFFINNLGNKYLFGYHVDVPSHNYLIREIFEDESYGIEDVETLYTYNLDFAKGFFQQKLEGWSQNNVKDLITKITERLLFSVLNLSETAGSNLDISMVFETLNFRGKQLSGLERFKNRVLYLVSKQNFGKTQILAKRNSINKTWLEIYKWLGRNPNPKKMMDDDAFLKAFWLLYFSNEKMVASDFKSYQKILFEKDFDLMNIHNNQYMMNPIELRKWLNCMKESVILWYFIYNPYEVDQDPDFRYHYTSNIQRSLLRLNSFPFGYGRYMLNLILAILVRLLPQKEDDVISEEQEQTLFTIEQFLWAAERHNIMCFLLNGNKTNYNQEATFRDINKYFRTGNAAESGISLKDQLLKNRVKHFTWKEVIRNLSLGNYFYTWDGIHFILKEYEEDLSGNMVEREISVNRIYPEEEMKIRTSYKDINRLGVAKKRKYSYALGNIFMSNNSQILRDFNAHKIRINNAINNNNIIYESEKELLNYYSWETTDIEKRSRKILEFLINKWQLPNSENILFEEYFKG
ncbi:Protein of unknown function DUF262 [Chryseobacterium oranimense]|uniref:GmrSD restriction endonucleases N-terminal domain-containing protein n=1 Tax=Chryseobacterium oranimense TaxID=421058 RepID=A0A1M5KQ11_9FLAO|nr:DUF262 domain-containing protein [Chryseobacterium oranimense]SHG54599.1 Protein of unknown function DUF262 [Chryseobacterium oranimense]